MHTRLPEGKPVFGGIFCRCVSLSSTDDIVSKGHRTINLKSLSTYAKRGGLQFLLVDTVHCIQGDRFYIIIKSEIFCGYPDGIRWMVPLNKLCKAF